MSYGTLQYDKEENKMKWTFIQDTVPGTEVATKQLTALDMR